MIPEVEQDTIDGVRVLRSDPVLGRHAAALTFRVGRFDEILPLAGITHMVEHLTFAGRPTARYSFNASVRGRYTGFYMESADPADIADFVGAVCDGLAADHGAALDRERVILRTEAASRGSAGALGSCLVERYGAGGPGLLNYRELGLHHVGWPQVEAWRRQWFTAGNAVLWIAGAIPDGLRIGLPAGPAMTRQDLRRMELTLPGFIAGAQGGIGLSLEGPRSLGAQVALDVLQQRLTRVLRHERGLVYDVQRAQEDLDRDTIHAWLAADALPESIPAAAHAMLTTFETLADAGCEAAEIEDYAARMRTAHESEGSAVAVLQRHAEALLSGREVTAVKETLRLAAELDPKAVGEAAQRLYERMIVAVPGDVPAVRGRMARIPHSSPGTVPGRALKSRDSDAVLTVGGAGVMLTAGSQARITIWYGAVAALVRWKDGKLTLIGTDGFSMQLDPDEWPGGPSVLDSIAARVHPSLVIPVNAPAAPRPGRGASGPGAARPAAGQPPAGRRAGWPGGRRRPR